MKKQITQKDLEEIVGGELPKLGDGEDVHAIVAAVLFNMFFKCGDYVHAKAIYEEAKARGGRYFATFKKLLPEYGINIDDFVNKTIK